MTELPEGQLLEPVNLAIDAHGSRLVKVLCGRPRDDKLALTRALAAAAGVAVEQQGRADRPRDQMTIMTGRGRATKLVTPTGINSYGAGRWFAVTDVEVAGIADLAHKLTEIEQLYPYSFLIRARLIDGRDPRRTRRLLYSDPETGEAPFFEPASRCWAGLDFDAIELPVGVDAVDLASVAALAVAKLPEPFRRASRWAQLTSGAGIKPGGRVRLFYWLDRALGRAELKRWLGAVPGLDFATLNDVTPNYVAKPLFVGVPDPVPERSRLIAGEVDAVRVPDLSEPERQAAPPPAEPRAYAAPARGLGFNATHAERYMLGCLKGLAGAPEGQGRDRCLRVAATLYGIAQAGLLEANDITSRIKGVMRDRGWRAGDPHGCTPDELDRILAWAWSHSEPKGLPR